MTASLLFFQIDGMIPGGVINPDNLLIETGIISGRKITSWPSLRTDLINAGGDWFDTQVMVDQGLVTSRKPEDISAFSEKMIEVFSQGDQQLRDTSPPL
ncbi:DJ-1/PfpI family protein [Bdellovibrio bacteriovorus]|uniref:DJ-1/PfpI family protein n=1 Tax=Bdellovibrio bacteriovorus TaxID=959 RepID=UPI003AA8CF34